MTNPSEMDDDLETGFYIAAGTAGVAAAGAVAAQAVVVYGGAAVATAVIGEAADTAIEAGASYATGEDIFFPTSPADLVQDGFKFLVKQGVKKGLKEAGEKGIKGAGFGGSGATGVEGGCFVFGTPVLISHETPPVLFNQTPAIAIVVAEPSVESSSYGWVIAGAGFILFAGAIAWDASKPNRKPIETARQLAFGNLVDDDSHDETL